MRYQVLEDNKPCDCHHHNVHASWSNSTFDKFGEAEAYALNWLGDYGSGLDGRFKVNEPFDYGYGSTIEIRAVE